MDEIVKILGIKINNLSLREAVEKIDSLISARNHSHVITVNPEMIMRAQKYKELKEIINNADLSLLDGAGILLVGRIIGLDLKERISGIDLMLELFKLAEDKRHSVYFLGAHPKIIGKAVKNISQKYPRLKIAGFYHGFFNALEEDKVIGLVKEAAPEIIFVGMGFPRQEKWLRKNLKNLGITVGIGVGGSFDVFGGKYKRAPQWFRDRGIEWFYRLLTQPWRARRMLALPHFFIKAIAEKIIR